MFGNNKTHRPRRPAKFFFFFVFAVAALIVVSLVIQFLWNEVLVGAVGVKPITFFHALGLFILSRILFGQYRFGSKSKKWTSHRRKAWREKWMQMDETDRAVMKEKWREWCKHKKDH